ncbi:type II toxin-antitoxin system RelE/ParE family toxin [Ralstonia sp. SET104]|uniref:type II toxin-antitoxin system RelE family toxin n=1 Tax=Ralstonia sp. SET104 TaxID=2448774 RepID=UPI000F5629DC|nr:type II toxin-antitoxin system RelE/ParE family toxin [Ralstonia sp. SET104]
MRAKIDALAVARYAPSPNAKKLAGREGYRLRVGDWRVLHQIEDGCVVTVALAIKPRGGAYQWRKSNTSSVTVTVNLPWFQLNSGTASSIWPKT